MEAVAAKLDNGEPMSISEMALALLALDVGDVRENVNGIADKLDGDAP